MSDILFGNNNQSSIKRLAQNSYRANKKETYLQHWRKH